LRDYTADGERLSLPGMAAGFVPMPHQRAAVARMILEKSVGLFHEVGAGKTAEMVIGATELKRLGLVQKPVLVVPDRMLEQVTREWLQLYPQAKLLAASSDDLPRERRRAFVARAATNDWDAIEFTRGAFLALPVATQTMATHMGTELTLVREQIQASRERDGSNADERSMNSRRR
jgi:N12 class adenine-specific DNA methylase